MNQIIEVHHSFDIPKVIAYDCGRDCSCELKISNNINTHKIGKYKITYLWPKYHRQIIINVQVIDRTSPKILLYGGNHITMTVNDIYKEKGYDVYDNVDHYLNEHVVVKKIGNFNRVGVCKIFYKVKDKSGNVATNTRYVNVVDDPMSKLLHYSYNQYDNQMEEWWFHKNPSHKRVKGAKSLSFLKKYHAYYIGPNKKVIYLTFDEGGNDGTFIKEIREVLKKKHVQATFFCTANYLKSDSEFIKKLVLDGNTIGNHSWHHYDMTTLANEHNIDKFCREITKNEQLYLKIMGKPMKKLFRFPRGASSERTLKMLNDLGYSSIHWSFAYYDYADEVSKEHALKTMLNHYHNGAIYLLHPNNRGNYEALAEFIDIMHKKGYRFSTLDEFCQ